VRSAAPHGLSDAEHAWLRQTAAPERSKASTSEVCLQALGRLVPVG